ncbi:ORF2 [Atractylodes mild mottle virus]|uniref:Aphid transmission protein n=1 Tax=Atractylodes mild mottle virus TaxID=1711685 RepID=A0A0M4J5R0_9VIRU|nr:ORF2 [Atractylodes mild mottle virus]ALD49087.1 ORF2 [Atractylodes mild mottle virus]
MVPPNTNEATQKPHIYKKGKILTFKKLNEGIDRTDRTYLFSSKSSGIAAVNNHCNNINQILGRTYLGTAKLLSYFGLSKDPSEDFSKEPSVFKKFFKDIPSSSNEGENVEKTLDNLKDLIEKQNSKLKNLEEKIDQLAKQTPEKAVNDLRDNLKKNLEEINDNLKKILG